MSKYAALRDYLRTRKTSPWHATFLEIEQVLGFSLPASARKYQAWWANQNRGTHVQCSGWLDAGWQTSGLNLNSERVTFDRMGGAHNDVARPVFKPTKSSLTWDDVLSPEGASAPLSLSVGFNWHDFGELHIDHKNRISFPRVPRGPAVYRFKLTRDSKVDHYIGETEEISLRLQHYRTPGPSQRTNLRLNELMSGCLQDGGAVTVSVARSVTAEIGGIAAEIQLSNKHERRLVEGAAIVAAQLANMRLLNH